MMLHALNFIQQYFSTWREHKIVWNRSEHYVKSEKKRTNIDWSNSREVMSYFMEYGRSASIKEDYIWMLARKWQDEIIHDTIPLDPPTTLHDFDNRDNRHKRLKL